MALRFICWSTVKPLYVTKIMLHKYTSYVYMVLLQKKFYDKIINNLVRGGGGKNFADYAKWANTNTSTTIDNKHINVKWTLSNPTCTVRDILCQNSQGVELHGVKCKTQRKLWNRHKNQHQITQGNG